MKRLYSYRVVQVRDGKQSKEVERNLSRSSADKLAADVGGRVQEAHSTNRGVVFVDVAK